MSLVLYNTLSRRHEVFQPLSPPDEQGRPQVKMYVCGVTVYDLCHLGHARAYIVWDTIRRYLQWRGYHVTYVQNFTDVDDKILKRAMELGQTMEEVAQRYIDAYFEDMDQLNILRADAYPRATQCLEPIITLIQSLQLRNFAYQVAGSADVYYSVHQFADYGQLSGRKQTDLQAGASGRVGEAGAEKRDPSDFALWKGANETEPGFPSPWGWGRPGWHIECSAMVQATLGNSIDIHGGGADLIFPHHENELAQSEPITGKPMAKYWVHNGFLNIGGEKMSKSLGNFTTLRDALKVYDPMALRLFFLQTQYRSPIDLTVESMEAASKGWETLSKGIQAAQHFSSVDSEADPDAVNAFQTAMDEDFGTPGAIALGFDLAKSLIHERNLLSHQGHTEFSKETLGQKSKALLDIAQVLGFKVKISEPIEIVIELALEVEVNELIEKRYTAKKNRDFQEADRIRDELKAKGISLIDQADGTTRWIADQS